MTEAPPINTTLTPQQLRILRLIADGMTDRQIATELYLGENTVKTHIRRIFAKLNAVSRAHAVANGFRQGLIT
jgi:DNA-binding NarL/FixJ family response regulator